MPAATGTLPHEHSEALAHVLEAARAAGGTLLHDLEHPLHQRFLRGLLGRAGMTPERYPLRFAALTTANGAREAGEGPVEGAFSDGQKIEFIGADEGGRTRAQAVFTRTNQILSATVTLTVTVQPQSGPALVLATHTEHMWKQQTSAFETDLATAEPYPPEGNVAGALTWQVQYADGTVESPSTLAVPVAQHTVGDPKVTDPCRRQDRKSGDLTAVEIGLARGFNDPGHNNSDIDYWFHRTSWEDTDLLVPFAGSMQFDQELAPLRPDPSDPNPVLQFTLAREEGGMSVLLPADTAPYLSGFSADPDTPGLLRFSLLPGDSDDGDTIDFGLSPWVADTRTYFGATVTVELSDGTQGIASVVSSDTPDTDPTDGIAHIDPLVYVWHCVVAGTQVPCADGMRAIEDCDVGTMVIGGHGGPESWPVLATLAQPYTGTLYEIACTNGHSLTCSGTHPLIKQGNVQVQAQALQPGDVLLALDGADTVIAVTPLPDTAEMLFNLWLDPESSGLTPTFYVNGLLTGDYTMQVSLLGEQRTPEALRASLPPELLTDFESSLEDRAKVA